MGQIFFFNMLWESEESESESESERAFIAKYACAYKEFVLVS